MLFMQRKPALSSRHLAPDYGYSERLWDHTTPRAASALVPDCRNQQLATAFFTPTSSSTLLRSPATSSSEVFSRVVISPGEDVSNQYTRTCSLDTRPNLTRTQTLDALDFSSESPFKHAQEQSPTSSHSSRTFSFAIISSPDTDITADDVTPKVEEIEDEQAVSLGEIKEQDHRDSDPRTCSGEPPVPTAIEAPRKRGRPRKHPLPTPGQAKVAKGRSKTGCITCRRRKKKCDETRPSCLNCQKNAVFCEGYPVKEIWKSGKQKMEEEVRKNYLAAIPRGLPTLIDGIETDVDRRFLDHFVFDFSRVLTLINDDSNPFKEILLPMATQHRGLMHSLMCLSGSHLSTRDPEPQFKERKHYHFDQAITDLRMIITSRAGTTDEPELPVNDPMIAATLALCLKTICEGETRGEYRSHMDATRYFLRTHPPKNIKFKQFIIEFFQYHDISNSLTTLDRRPLCLTGDLRLPDFVPHAQAGALLGIFDGLFHYISEITILRDRIRQRIIHGIEPWIDYQTLSEAVSIDSSIRAWEPIYPPDNPNWYAAQLYRQSTWVYLYRTMRPSRPSEKISRVVDDGLVFLDQLPIDAGANSIMLMPLFLLGCSAFETKQRERIKRGFDSLQAYSSLRNIEPALRVVEKVWEIMDHNIEESWDWEKIIEDMDMDFLIT
ncbi:OefC protein [Blastomyces dermatitidis ATCC 18188]|uniref:OefC protein n=1 Tax=Ajellomyces dermatitidis (strain ATCC 18188 / CBS 674.68) TaxID=653446 RepID=F2TBA8_AJEDA|nr:OefC protein [Blastomyces dermatitidis ATCC 18188]